MEFIKEFFYTFTRTETGSSYLIFGALVIFLGFGIFYWTVGGVDWLFNLFSKQPKSTTGYNHMKPFEYEPKNPVMDYDPSPVSQQDSITNTYEEPIQPETSETPTEVFTEPQPIQSEPQAVPPTEQVAPTEPPAETQAENPQQRIEE